MSNDRFDTWLPGIIDRLWPIGHPFRQHIVDRWSHELRRDNYTISRKKRQRIYERDGNKCLTCGATQNLTIDHIWPRVLGGTDADSNLQTLCRRCNALKGGTIPGTRRGKRNRFNWYESEHCTSRDDEYEHRVAVTIDAIHKELNTL